MQYMNIFSGHPAFSLAAQSEEIVRTVNLKKSYLCWPSYSLLSNHTDLLTIPPPATGPLHRLIPPLQTASFPSPPS